MSCSKNTLSILLALTFTGQRSPQSEEIVLRGVVYYEPWLQVTTADNKTGWVFGVE